MADTVSMDVTRDEWEALRLIVQEWMTEGPPRPAFPPAYESVFAKLDLEGFDNDRQG